MDECSANRCDLKTTNCENLVPGFSCDCRPGYGPMSESTDEFLFCIGMTEIELQFNSYISLICFLCLEQTEFVCLLPSGIQAAIAYSNVCDGEFDCDNKVTKQLETGQTVEISIDEAECPDARLYSCPPGFVRVDSANDKMCYYASDQLGSKVEFEAAVQQCAHLGHQLG